MVMGLGVIVPGGGSGSGPGHPTSGNETNHIYVQDAAPVSVEAGGTDPLKIGDVWSDTTANLVKRTTGINPDTFTSVEGAPSFGAPTGDIDIGDAAVEGASGDATRADHQHAFPAPGAGYPVDTDFTAEADGAATTPARSDHRHNIPAPAAPTGDSDIGAAAAAGAGGQPSREDHVHAFPAPGAGYPQNVDFGAESDGAATTPARSDHRHTLDVPAAPTGDVDIGDAAVVGVGGQPAREDHQHAFPAPAGGYPQDVAAAEADGAATTPARADHVHAHGSGFSPDAHQPRSHDHSAAADNTALVPESVEVTGGPFSLRGDISPTIAAQQDNWNPTGLADATVIRITATGAQIVTGLVGGADGRQFHIFNIAADNVTLSDEDAASTAANRFALGESIVLSQDEGVLIMYDSTSSRWRAMTRVEPAGGVTFAIPTGDVDIGDAAVEGVSGDSTRADHQHAFPAPGAGYPLDVDFDAEADGAATTPARSDHKHSIPEAVAPSTADIGDSATIGTGASPSREDHIHGFPAPGAGYPLDTDFTAEDDGVATTPARSDHRHNIPAPAAPTDVDIGDTAATGSGGQPSREDHLHGSPAPAGGYPVDVDFDAEIDGVATTPARSDHKHTIPEAVAPTTADIGDSATIGTGASPSREDHIHGFPAPAGGYPQDVADAEADGAATTPARSDHAHAFPSVDVEAWLSAAGMKGAVTDGAGDADNLPESAETATNNINYDYMAFDQTTEEEAFFQWRIPQGWNEGTITYQPVWTGTGVSTGTVQWGLKSLARGNSDPLDTAYGSETTTVALNLDADLDVMVSAESGAHTIGGTPATGDLVFFAISRKTAGDNMAADARLLGVIITYTRVAISD